MRAQGEGSSPGRVEGSSRAMLATARPYCLFTALLCNLFSNLPAVVLNGAHSKIWGVLAPSLSYYHPPRPAVASVWVSWSLSLRYVIVCFCVCCPRFNSKLTWAINAELDTLIVHGMTSTCTDPKVKGQGHAMFCRRGYACRYDRLDFWLLLLLSILVSETSLDLQRPD